MKFVGKKLFLFGLFSLFFLKSANAYIDPGTGSFVIQLLIAGFLGALYALKVFWRQALSFVLGAWRGLKGFFVGK